MRPWPPSKAACALLVGFRNAVRADRRGEIDVTGLQHVLGFIVLHENYHGQAGAIDLVFLLRERDRFAAMTLGLVLVEVLSDLLADGLQIEVCILGALTVGLYRVALA